MAHGTPDYSPLATSSIAELPTYRLYAYEIVASGAGAYYALSCFNPAASGVLAKLRRILFTLRFTGNVDGITQPNFVLNRTTTAGTGAGLTPFSHDTHDPPSALTCLNGIVAAPLSSGAILAYLAGTERRRALQPDRGAANAFTFDLYHHPAAGQMKPITLYPGEGVTLFVVPSIIGFDYILVPEWTEEPYTP